MRQKYYSNAYRRMLKRKIENLPGEVFQRKDVTVDYSSYAQLRLTRALKAFVDEHFIIKIAHGLYAKAKLIELPSKESRSILRKNFESIVIEALNKLHIRWDFGTAIQEYNRGETQQIPIRFTLKLKNRLRRNIEIHNRKVYFEGGVNAR